MSCMLNIFGRPGGLSDILPYYARGERRTGDLPAGVWMNLTADPLSRARASEP